MNNSSNEGLIMAQFKNITDKPVTIHAGDRIVQGVFAKYFTVDDDNADGERTGGFGSTGNYKRTGLSCSFLIRSLQNCVQDAIVLSFRLFKKNIPST